MMTRPTATRRAAAAATAATLTAVLLSGCGMFQDDEKPAKPAATPSTPAPTGNGPYPEPSNPQAGSPQPTGEAGEPKGGIPSPGDVDRTDATAVSKAALTALSTYDTAIDRSRNDAGRRVAAAGWCTAPYAAQLKAAANQAAPGGSWSTWTQHKAYTKATLQETAEAGRPQDTATTAYRQWTITVTPHGRDGWIGPAETSAAFVELTRAAAGQPWHLNSVSVQ